MVAKIEIASSGFVTSLCDPSCTAEDMVWVESMLEHLRQYRYPTEPTVEPWNAADYCPKCSYRWDMHSCPYDVASPGDGMARTQCSDCGRWLVASAFPGPASVCFECLVEGGG